MHDGLEGGLHHDAGLRVALGMALGLPLGAAVGMIFFDSIAIVAGVGISAGVAVGAALEYSRRTDEHK